MEHSHSHGFDVASATVVEQSLVARGQRHSRKTCRCHDDPICGVTVESARELDRLDAYIPCESKLVNSRFLQHLLGAGSECPSRLALAEGAREERFDGPASGAFEGAGAGAAEATAADDRVFDCDPVVVLPGKPALLRLIIDVRWLVP